MVLQGEILVKLEGFAGKMGEFIGGAKLAGQGKQPEGTPTGASMAGGLGMKALLGTEGFGGLKKSMVGMSGPIGKMGGAMMKGGLIGIATGAISSIMAILTKALGSSSIFTGVAAQFWKIAGVMVDVLLMPLLPIMMKFIQWMMTDVMPEIMKLSTAINKALQGDLGPIIGQLTTMLIMVLRELFVQIPRMLVDAIYVAVRNALPKGFGGFGGEAKSISGWKKEREEKGAGREGGGIELSPVRNIWIPALTKRLRSMGDKQKEFGDNMIKTAENSDKKLGAFVDKEKNLGRVWWKQWDLGLWGNSTLPNIKDNTQEYLETLSTEAEGSGDGLFSWIGNINWGVFGTVGTAIKDAASAVWGSVAGFFTGKDAEGTEVTPSIMSILPKVPILGDIIGTLGGIKDTIVTRAKDVWHAVLGFFTGKGTTNPGPWEGKSIFSILPDIPDLGNIIKTMFDIKTEIVTRAKAIFHSIIGFFTGKGTSNPGAWEEGDENIYDIIPDIPILSGIITTMFDITGAIKARAVAMYDGVVEFFTVTLPGMLPDVGGMMGSLFSFQLDTGTWLEMLTKQARGGIGVVSKTGKEIQNRQGKDEYELTVGIGEMLSLMGTMIKDAAMRPINWLTKKYESLTTFLAGISMPDLSWSGIQEGVKKIINGITGFINEQLCSIFNSYNNMTFGPFSVPARLQVTNIPQIPTWHTGGIVPGGPGTQVPAILQGGEQVIPRSQRQNQGGGGGMNQVFNINITSNYSPGDIIKSIAQSGATDEVAYLNTVG